jgi:hypothetical protein
MIKKIVVILAALTIVVFFAGIVSGGNPLDENDGNEDPDNDSLLNWEEQVLGTDPYNTDSDNDGLPDGWEHRNNLNPAVANDAHLDADGEDDGQVTGEKRASFSEVKKIIDVWPSDGFTKVASLVLNENEIHYDNYEEYYRAYYDLEPPHGILFMHTDPNLPDTDNDGLLDPDDPEPLDYDNDGTSPGGEGGDQPNDGHGGDEPSEPDNPVPPDTPPDEPDNPKPPKPGPPTPTTDSDGDMVPDLLEPDLLTDPNDWDTDNDHLADGNEPGTGIGTGALVPDSDNDGI